MPGHAQSINCLNVKDDGGRYVDHCVHYATNVSKFVIVCILPLKKVHFLYHIKTYNALEVEAR